MKQRAKLAQALVHDPRLVLLDEPTNGLDPASRDSMLDLVRRIGTEFGIAVLVTSHLLGELERVSDHVIVLDSGALLRSSATTDFLHTMGSLLIEVQGKPDADRLLGQALVDAGLQARPGEGGLVEVDVIDETTHDIIRDLTVALDLGLVRMQERHHRIEDVFREGVAGGAQPR
jgi:ABC-2 type transport system ATP-binding protein